MEALATQLFGLFERGEYDAAGKYFAPGALVYSRYGREGVNGPGMSYDAFKRSVASGPLSKLGSPKYLNRRVTVTSNGFIEQHTTCFNIAARRVEMPCVIVCTCNADGHITSLEEYLDPFPLTKALAEPSPEPLDPPMPLRPHAVVVVTGAGSGIGEQIARQYAARGCSIVLAGRRKDQLERVAADCRQDNPTCRTLVVPTDVSRESDCQNLVEVTCAQFGEQIDRLVLNAGISQSCYLRDSSPAMLKQLIDVNFYGSALLAMAALPYLVPSQSHLAVISSALGKLAAPTQTGYAASKWACHGFFDSLRAELQEQHIGVTIVCPGPVNTNILGNLSGPGGRRVGFSFSEATLSTMMSSSRAAELAINACEKGQREIVFGKDLQKLVKLRATHPQRVDNILGQQYTALHRDMMSRL